MGENSGKVGLASPSDEEERRKSSDRNISDDLLLKEIDEVRVKRKTLEAVLQECQRALEFIGKDPAMSAASSGNESDDGAEEEERSETGDSEAEELCDLLKLRVESPNFLEKLESMDQSVMPNKLEENSSWDVISKNDLWGESSDAGPDGDGYVIVKKEDIVDGIACFMATYLLSLKETRVCELTPNQLQEALRKTFSGKKRKGKLQKAWDGSKVLYNVASWGATAMGIYQNPALVKAASTAFWTSCRVISRLM